MYEYAQRDGEWWVVQGDEWLFKCGSEETARDLALKLNLGTAVDV